MRLLKIRITVVLICLLCCDMISAFCIRQDVPKRQDILSRQASPTLVTSDNFRLVLGDLANKYDVPIGFEGAVASHRHADKVSSVSVDGNIRQILDAVVTVAPQYEWQELDGVINLVPKSDQDLLLNVSIRGFKVQNSTTGEIVSALFESPEVKEALLRMGLTRDDTTPFPAGETKESARFSFSLQDVTVRDILNYLIRTTPNRYWSVHRVESDRQLFSVVVW